MMLLRLKRMSGAFRTDRRAVAAIEFAVALPVLLIMYLGGYALSDAIGCSRKVTTATRAVADLTSQYSILSDSGIATILNASTQIMAPYPTDNAQVSVTQVFTDAKGATTVVWSKGINGAPTPAPGTAFAIPATIANKSTYLLYGKITYSYFPPAGFGSFGPMTFSDSIYMSPRISDSVTNA